MKKGLFVGVFVLLVLGGVILLINAGGDNHDVILRLSSSSNAHGANYSYESYDVEINFFELFGWHHGYTNPHECTGSNRILNLSSESNAHAEKYPSISSCEGTSIPCGYYDFNENWCDNQIGCSVQGTDENKWCSGNVKDCDEFDLESPCTNQDACSWEEYESLEGRYNVEICYGDLVCYYVEDGLCESSPGVPLGECIVTLSDSTNAHLAECDSPNAYPNKICCISIPGAVSGGLDTPAKCQGATDKAACLALSNNCTWTPPGSVNETVAGGSGGCCGYQGVYYGAVGCVYETSGELCNNVFDPMNPKDTLAGLDTAGGKYCAKITSGLSYGFWYEPVTY